MNNYKKVKDLARMFLGVWLLVLVFWSCGESATDVLDKPEPPKTEITPGAGMDLYGLITDDAGNPVSNVVVSDGFSCITTDADGVYQMKKNENAQFVFYSTPAEYEVNTASESVKVASFYAAIGTFKRHDFSLKKLPAVENSFKLLCIGDPQVASANDVNRFKVETMPDIQAFTNAASIPCYGLVMGDMVGDKPAFLEQMKALIGSSSMPVFTTIGNHDKVAGSNKDLPRTTEAFTKVFGPLNYSFNRGEVHFVCLDNIIFDNASAYSGGFTDEQMEWLKKDLSYVPKNKMVIIYYHIPIRGASSFKNRAKLFAAVEGFAEVHLMCGHTHYSENYIHTSSNNIYEHVHAAACGSWWRSTLNGDGTPNGYAVYDVNGASLTNWFYKPTKLSADFQIRLHQGDLVFGGEYGYYTFDQGENTVVVNVWNADSEWKVEAFENGVKVADLQPMSKSMKDAWTLGYHIGVLNRNPNNYSPASKHLYLHEMHDPDAKLEVKVTDRFGNTYTEDEITTGYETAESYN
ncbi:calcineurin-like phosphoesterase C-terminal domain-containing protein [Sunxiuqinia elliptica]